MAASRQKRNATTWHLSVRLSVCLSHLCF